MSATAAGVGDELITRAKAGDATAFLALVEQHRDRVYAYLWRCGLDRATCDDLAQEVFIKVHAGLPSYVPERPLRAWIMTIAANTVRSHLRRRATRQQRSDVELDEPPSDEPDAFATAASRETAALLDKGLLALSLAQRQVVLLCCVEGLAQEQVAAALDLPVNTVKTHLRRARLALADFLARNGRST